MKTFALLTLTLSLALSSFGQGAFRADSGTFGTALATTSLDTQGNVKGSNAVTGASFLIGTNSHWRMVDQFSTTNEFYTNYWRMTWTNGNSIAYSNGLGFYVGGVLLFNPSGVLQAISGSALTGLNASALASGTVPLAVLPGSVLTNGGTQIIVETNSASIGGLGITNGALTLKGIATIYLNGGAGNATVKGTLGDDLLVFQDAGSVTSRGITFVTTEALFWADSIGGTLKTSLAGNSATWTVTVQSNLVATGTLTASNGLILPALSAPPLAVSNSIVLSSDGTNLLAESQTAGGTATNNVAAVANPGNGQVPQWNGSKWVPATVAGSGTVTSVGASGPAGFTWSSAVTGAGTLTATTPSEVLTNGATQLVTFSGGINVPGAMSIGTLTVSNVPILNLGSSTNVNATNLVGRIATTVKALSLSGTGSTNCTVDFSLGNKFSLTLTTNAYFIQPTNIAPMQEVLIDVRQDATGTRTLNFDTNYWKFPSGQILTTATNANSWSVISGVAGQFGTNVACVQTLNFQ